MRPAFYSRPVLEVARELIGCVVSHEGCAGVIVEAEAYHDSEPACHAYVGLTERTRTLFGPPGRAYVYRSYGVHALLNAVSEPEGVGAAVLIRALEPVEGIDTMRERRGHDRLQDLCSGPGKLTQALGIELDRNGCDLARGPVVIARRPRAWRDVEVVVSRRIGITRAVELPWRFCAVGSRCLSRPALSRLALSRLALSRAKLLLRVAAEARRLWRALPERRLPLQYGFIGDGVDIYALSAPKNGRGLRRRRDRCHPSSLLL